MIVTLKNYKVFGARSHRGFIILELIIAMLILNFYILIINTFLLDVIKFLAYLEFTTKNFIINRNVNSCLSVYHNEDLCNRLFAQKISNENKNI